MSQFLESIACKKGQFELLNFHQERVNRTFAAFYPGLEPHDLGALLQVPTDDQLYKFRVMYDGNSARIEHAVYTPKEIKSIRLVEADVDYSFKFLDRTPLINLVEGSGSDDVIIVKNGLITDSSYSNLAFFDRSNWWTPKQPLLHGVRRAHLLEKGTIQEIDIKVDDLPSFEKVSLINAILDLGKVEVDLGKVHKNT